MKNLLYPLFFLSATVASAGPVPPARQVQLPADAPACVQWAAEQLDTTLAQHGMGGDRALISVMIDAPATAEITAAEQTFTIARATNDAVQVKAGGPVGAMYALEDLDEQLIHSSYKTWKEFQVHVHTGTQKPYLEIRADNPFVHVYPLLLNDLEMWRAYIDNLARNRFNLLDMHGAYDLETTSFPNLYPQLVEVPGYPTAGGFTPEYRAKNLASFKAILAYAKSRGVRVSFMNYSAVNDRGGVHKGENFLTNVPTDKLAEYTAVAVKLLIQELPDLYMLGFRVGESGQPASFYKQAYLKGVADANRPDLRLYTRSWQTTKDQLEPIAAAARNGFDIEIKFNGEQLGLPYQSMQGAKYGSYSYQGYLDVPADYQIIWQIRANGSHRFWAWENTDFIRRTVEACQLGHARGYTLEPQTAYFSVYPKDYYRDAADAATYQYEWQKYWMWYYAWGRLGFDPTLPESMLRDQFRDHYGSAGDAAYEAMQQSGTILPLAYAYRFVGPDQRDFSPETESGNFDGKAKRARQDLLQYAENHPEDERAFAGIDVYVQERLSHTADGRHGPFAVAARLDSAAKSTEQTLHQAAPPTGHAAAEWRILRADLLSAAYFGEYHRDRILGMTYLDFALRTGSDRDYATAQEDLKKSREDWRQLSENADAIYRPLSNPLRRQPNYQWASESPRLETLDATAATFWALRTNKSSPLHLAPLLQDVPDGAGLHISALEERVHDGTATITAHVASSAGVKTVILWWKPLPSELDWKSQPMTVSADGLASTSIPVDTHGAMYMIDVQDTRGNAKNFPDPWVETPYRIIPATEKQVKQ